MANLSKIKRDEMIAFLDELKKTHSDDASIRAFNMIENHLREKKYGLVWEEHSEEVDELLAENIPVLTADKDRRLCTDENLPWNFIIQGDNLQALYLLEKTHRGKVDCIYIDPPYNTGAKDWKYNNDYVDGQDEYRHSKWLSMMERRLSIAKKLLCEDGVMIVAIDDYEVARLIVLLEDLFPNYDVLPVIVNHHPQGGAAENISRTHEYALFVTPKGQKVIKGNKSENIEETWSLTRGGTDVRNLRKGRPNSFYAIYVNEKTRDVVGVGPRLSATDKYDVNDAPDGCIAFYPIGKDGTERVWRYERDSMKKHIEDGDIICSTKMTLSVKKKRDVKYEPVFSVWTDGRYNAGTHGTSLTYNLFSSSNRFSYPKSLYTVVDCVKWSTQGKSDAVIVDFFAGSGTTMHAVNLLNAEDDGNRTCIMVTNNEISEAEEKDFEKRGLKKGDAEWESHGIAQYITWPRTVCSIKGVDINGNQLKGNYLDTDRPMADGLKANVKFFKCDWTPRKPEDYLLSNALCLHIREMIELQNAIEIDNIKNVLILNKSDLKKYILDPERYVQVQNVWINQNIILNAEELKLLEAKGYKYIPREFFGQELREAAE